MLPLTFACLQGSAAGTEDFPPIVNSQAPGEHPPPPDEMPELFELPPGFRVTLFAGEPDVQQPIAFEFDDRARIWVAENYTYASHGKIDQSMRDRIIILEDTDRDGQHDLRKVFWDKGTMLTGLTWGYGGIWILNDGTLSFIPDRNGDDIPDSEPVVMLDGWTREAGHNFVNGLIWGPDGWLYGRHGITESSLPGTPDSPAEQRRPMNCGIWRFHPLKHTFEIVCHGTTNPWGLDYNRFGDMFMSNNVIGHFWHVIPGAHYERMFGQDFNPHCYELIGPTSDHYHWDHAGAWHESRDGKADDLGGGHSHCGLMIYQGQNFPPEYRGRAFMCNTHGRCINVDFPERSGSTFTAKHERNFLKVNTPWFRGVELKYGPAGCVFLSDWADNGECHDHDGVHRTSGRIYRISYGDAAETELTGIRTDSPQQLAETALRSENEWLRRHAARKLAESRSTQTQPAGSNSTQPTAAEDRLVETIRNDSDATEVSRAGLLLSALDRVSAESATLLLRSQHEPARAVGIRMVAESPELQTELADLFLAVPDTESSPTVLLAFASALQKLAETDSQLPADSPSLSSRVINRLTDGNALNVRLADLPVLRLMLWYGIECHWQHVPRTARTGDTLLERFMMRRTASGSGTWDEKGSLLVRKLSDTATLSTDRTELPKLIAARLNGVLEGLRGHRRLAEPEGWSRLAERLKQFRDPQITDAVTQLSTLFGNGEAMESLRSLIADRNGDPRARAQAIAALASADDPDTVAILLPLLNDRAVYVDVAHALAAFDDPRVPEELLKRWDNLRHGAREAACDTMCSRRSYAVELAKALNDGRVDSGILTAADVRRLLSFQDAAVTEAVEQHWGVINDSPAERKMQIAALKERLTPNELAAADPERGAAIFRKSCSACHRLYGEGGRIGPDLTGGNRANMDYLLGNIIDPSAEVPRQYTVSVLVLKSGRVITGVIVAETDEVLTVQTDKEAVPVAISDVEERTRTTKSLMPDGLLDNLSPGEVRDLIGFVSAKR